MRTAERLRALGHAPLVAPLLQVEPTGDPPPTEPFDAILLTSPNAVPGLARLDAAAKSRPVFAVGERAGVLAREAGFSDVRYGATDGAALAAWVQQTLPPSCALLHIAGRDRKSEPHASLAAAGHRVTVWTAYAAVAAAGLPSAVEAALSAGEIGAVLHYSRRSAAILRRLVESAGMLERLDAVAQICLSRDVAEALPGALRVVIAPSPSEDAMLAALANLGGRA